MTGVTGRIARKRQVHVELLLLHFGPVEKVEDCEVAREDVLLQLHELIRVLVHFVLALQVKQCLVYDLTVAHQPLRRVRVHLAPIVEHVPLIERYALVQHGVRVPYLRLDVHVQAEGGHALLGGYRARLVFDGLAELVQVLILVPVEGHRIIVVGLVLHQLLLLL